MRDPNRPERLQPMNPRPSQGRGAPADMAEDGYAVVSRRPRSRHMVHDIVDAPIADRIEAFESDYDGML